MTHVVLHRYGVDENWDWVEDAACRGVDANVMVPDGRHRGNHDRANVYDEARKICARCPVRRQCLDAAMDHPALQGMWGGLSPQERRRVRRQQREQEETS